jgi:hypothetical protein
MKDYLKSFRNMYRLPIGYKPNQTALRAGEYEHIDERYKQKVAYTINEHGLRGTYVPSNKLIAFAGCSMTFGIGVDDKETYPHLVTEKLGSDWGCLNIAHPGSGPDVQMANITWAIDNFKIDKLCWYMSDPHRQIVIPEENTISLYVPVDNNILPSKLAKRFIEVNTKLEETWWYRTYWNIKTIFSLCKAKNIDVYMTCWQGEYDYRLKELKDEYGVKELGNMHHPDRARDALHPGPESQADFAERIYGVVHEV